MQDAQLSLHAGSTGRPVSISASGRPAYSTFWLCFWMGVVLVAMKAVYFPVPDTWTWSNLSRYAGDVVSASGGGVFYALVVGLAGQAALSLCARRPMLRSLVWYSLLAFCTASVVYAVISVRLFELLRMPLTRQLLYLAGDVKNMQSSVGAFLTPGIQVALIGLPILYLALVVVCDRWLWFFRRRGARIAQTAGALAVVQWFGYTQTQFSGHWGTQRDDRRIANNPHAIMIASWFSELFGQSSVVLEEDFPAAFQADFETAGARPDRGQPTPGIPRGPRNVIVVICESVGTQHLSLYGSRFKTWPRMEEEARHAIVFDNYYSHITNTANSLASLTLSIYSPMTWRELTVERPDVPGVTAAEVLRDRGYRTAFITAGDNAYANQDEFLSDRGFDTVLDSKALGCPEVSSWGVEDECMVDATLRFVDQDRAKPFYVFAWTQATHHPYDPAPDWDTIDFLKGDESWGDMGWDLNRYMNAIHETDRQIKRLMDELRARGLADDTLVIISGDHGEAFGVPHKNYYHSGKVYQEDVNVPFMIWNPKLFQTPQRSQVIGAHVDLSATILDLLEIPLPPGWQGRSLLSPERPPRAYFYGVMDGYILGVREGNLKYVFNADSGIEELYDLANDRVELQNIAGARPEDAKRLRQRLAAWVDYQKRAAR